MSDWKADSEYGHLHEVLLCRPEHYRWRQTSAISEATLASGKTFNPARALAQHGQLVDALEGASVSCSFLDPDPALPYQVFTRDSSFLTPWGPLVTQMHQPWRRGEYAAVVDFHADRKVEPWRKITAGSLEGGDVIPVRPGALLIGSGETRTEWTAAEQLAGWFRDEGWEVRIEPTPQRFVHMDVVVCVLADGIAAVCREIASGGLMRWLDGLGFDFVEVPVEVAFGLGVNVLSLGGDKVVSACASDELNAQLRALGLEVLDPELDAFTLGGGGPHCLTQPLRRDLSPS